MKLSPGIVTGKDYKALVSSAKAGGYTIPAVNVVSSSGINAVLEAAAKNKSDVIIQISNGGAQFYAGKGLTDSFRAKVLGAISAARHAHTVAKEYGICVAMHTDHANKSLIPWVEALIDASEEEFQKTGKPLFSSHMLDLSEETLEDNLSESARILQRLTPMGMSLEIELGLTGGEEDGLGSELTNDDVGNPKLYTQPQDVLRAYELLSPIGHFSVAASFGNVHGVYKLGNVKLRPEILKNSQDLVMSVKNTGEKPLNLVFHGGSGSEEEKIREAVGYGVFKMNIDTDMQFAYSHEIGKYVKEHSKAFDFQIDPDDGTPYKKQYDPRAYLRKGEEGIIQRLSESFSILGSREKSLAQAPSEIA
ncbi:class II fructose-bisphosphate aldolase [Candidatus Peregrinibacteria bacterium]|nr:MAG: class II fructose-bisphosphate aldolase [Candidatus Peregrinibacteria bacterium]